MAVVRKQPDQPVFDPDASRSQWLKGVLEICVLSIISRGEAYGYEVAQQLTAAGLGEIKGGTLYPRLAALEKAGLVEVEWRIGDNGPSRKYYRTTAAGLSMLDQSRVEYRRFNTAVNELLENPDRSISRGTAAQT